MSIWSQLDGTLNLSKSRNISVRKMVGEFFHGEDYSLVVNEINDTIFNVSINLEADGDCAIKKFKKFLVLLEDKNIMYDVNLSVRFVN